MFKNISLPKKYKLKSPKPRRQIFKVFSSQNIDNQFTKIREKIRSKGSNHKIIEENTSLESSINIEVSKKNISFEKKINSRKRIYRQYGMLIRNKLDEEDLDNGCKQGQLGYQSRQKPWALIQNEPNTDNKIKRVRSYENFNFSHNSNNSLPLSNLFQQNKLKNLQHENTQLKQDLKSSYTALHDIKQSTQSQKLLFQQQKQKYQDLINLLKNKIKQSRKDIGHLYYFQQFDPISMMVKPIVQLEERSSIFDSSIFKGLAGNYTFGAEQQYETKDQQGKVQVLGKYFSRNAIRDRNLFPS